MDISEIKPAFINKISGIKIGNTETPAIVEFINLRCPFCRQWFEESFDSLEQAAQENKLHRVIKLLDKEKASLQRGNMMHKYVPFNDPEQALAAIKKIFSTQDEWGDLSLEEVELFAENKLGLTQEPHQDAAFSIVAEAAKANVNLVPSIFFKEEIFDESISKDELQKLIG